MIEVQTRRPELRKSVVRANLGPYDEIRVRGGRDDRRGAWLKLPGR